MACGDQSSSTQELNTQDSAAPVKAKPQVVQLAQGNLDSILAMDSVVLIDVRTPGEIAQGYIPQADTFIDFNSANFSSALDSLDKNYTYVMYCRSGGRSGKASQMMVNKGFQTVYNLVGGILSYPGELKKPE